MTLFVGSVIGSIIGAVVMLYEGADTKLAIPFGPFMVSGALIGIMVGPAIADWYAGLLGV